MADSHHKGGAYSDFMGGSHNKESAGHKGSVIAGGVQHGSHRAPHGENPHHVESRSTRDIHGKPTASIMKNTTAGPGPLDQLFSALGLSSMPLFTLLLLGGGFYIFWKLAR
jgi:hypothetical protein